MHLNGTFFWTVDFLNTVEAKVIILTWYVKPNEKIVFSQTMGPIELKFHVKTPYAKLAKIYTKGVLHLCPRMDFFKLCIIMTRYIQTMKMYVLN